MSRAVLRVENRHGVATQKQKQNQEQTAAKVQAVQVEARKTPAEVPAVPTEARNAPAEAPALLPEAHAVPTPTEARTAYSRIAAVQSFFARFVPGGGRLRGLTISIMSRLKIYRIALLIFWIRRFISARRWLVATTVVCGLVLAMIILFRPTASDDTDIPFDEPILVYDTEINLDDGLEGATDTGASYTGASGVEGGPLLVPGTPTPGKSAPIVSETSDRKHGGAWLTGTIETISDESPVDRTVRTRDINWLRQ